MKPVCFLLMLCTIAISCTHEKDAVAEPAAKTPVKIPINSIDTYYYEGERHRLCLCDDYADTRSPQTLIVVRRYTDTVSTVSVNNSAFGFKGNINDGDTYKYHQVTACFIRDSLYVADSDIHSRYTELNWFKGKRRKNK